MKPTVLLSIALIPAVCAFPQSLFSRGNEVPNALNASNVPNASTFELSGSSFTLYINAQNVVVMNGQESEKMRTAGIATETITEYKTEYRTVSSASTNSFTSTNLSSVSTVYETVNVTTTSTERAQSTTSSLITLEISGTTTTVTPTGLATNLRTAST